MSLRDVESNPGGNPRDYKILNPESRDWENRSWIAIPSDNKEPKHITTRTRILTAGVRGGATVLKVGGDKFCERSEQKIFFDPPHFLASGGGTKYCLHR